MSDPESVSRRAIRHVAWVAPVGALRAACPAAPAIDDAGPLDRDAAIADAPAQTRFELRFCP